MKIGIALGGGGAKGFAHIGVLQVLAEEGIDCQVVAGTSIGALVGAVYCVGQLEALERDSCAIKLTEVPRLLSPTWSTQGLFSGKNALELIRGYTKITLIEQLPKTFAAVSVDLLTGAPVVHTRGDLDIAVRSSVSIPVLFTPVVENDAILVDGGVLDPVPVRTARELGADIVLAVDLFGFTEPTQEELAILNSQNRDLWPPGITDAMQYLRSLSAKMPFVELFKAEQNPKRRLNVLDVVERTLVMSQRELTQQRLKEWPADVVIRPAVASVGLLDFHRGKPVVELGRLAARAALPKIREALSGGA